MATEAWRGFIHSWHTLGKFLKWMCISGIGIPIAFLTCVLIACAALIFAILCLLVAATACAVVFYFLKGIYVGVLTLIHLIYQRQYQSTILPTSNIQKGLPIVHPPLPVQLHERGSSAGIGAPSEPLGYVYPWYEGNLHPPPQVHLNCDQASESNLSMITAPRDDRNLKDVAPAEVCCVAKHKSQSPPPSSIQRPSLVSNPHLASEQKLQKIPCFIPYCKVCKKAKPKSQFPTRSITSRCSHHPEICLACLSDSITQDFEESTWQRICCPLCNLQLDYQDVKEFGRRDIFEKYVDTLISRKKK